MTTYCHYGLQGKNMQHTQKGQNFTEIVLEIFKVSGLLAAEGDRLARELGFENNPQHKRANYVVLTGKGKKVYSMISEKQIPWANQKSKKISAADLNTTLTTLRKITSLLET
jgi:predicted transcriptional regulator